MSDRTFESYVVLPRSRGRPRRTVARHRRSPTPYAVDESTSGNATTGNQDVVVIDSDLEDQQPAGSSRRHGTRGRRPSSSRHGPDNVPSRSPPPAPFAPFARREHEGPSRRRSLTPTERSSSTFEFWAGRSTQWEDIMLSITDDSSAEVPSSPIYRDWSTTGPERTEEPGSSTSSTPTTRSILAIPAINATINVNLFPEAILSTLMSAVSPQNAVHTQAEVPDSTRQPHQGRQATSSRRGRTRNDASSSNVQATPSRRDRGSRGAPTSPEVQEIPSLPPRAATAAARREAEECRPPMAGHVTSVEEGRLLVCASCGDQLSSQLFALQCGHVVCGGCVGAFREKKPCCSCGKKSSRRDAILQLYV